MSTTVGSRAAGVESAPTSTDTPTVSARILKKRETDRKCQRMIRERTKSRIAYLEDLVERFREQDPSGRVETLMHQLSEMRAERDQLEKKVKNIESIIAGGKVKDEPGLHDISLMTLASENVDDPPAIAATHPSARESQSPLDDGQSSTQDAQVYPIHNRQYSAYLESAATNNPPSTGLHSRSHQHGACECSNNPGQISPAEVGNRWRYANDTLTEWFKWSPEVLDMQDYFAYNDDVPIRAVVEGWDAVEQQGHMHPAWRLLRGIDENIFGGNDPRERLGILQLMGWLILAHINPTREQHMKLPPFYLKRPTQDMLHSYAIEFFAWPGLRERFVYSEHRYCSMSFWRLFCQNVRIVWPYEFRDCYTRNLDTGLYKLSPTFHERISDIRAWTMGIDMFKQWPELYGDIPAWNHIPASMNSTHNFSRPARIALPPSTEISESSGSRRDSGRRDSQGQAIQQMRAQFSNLTPKSPGVRIPQASAGYPCSPHGSGDGTSTPLTTPFKYPYPNTISTVAETQHTSMVPAWDYTGGFHGFSTHTT